MANFVTIRVTKTSKAMQITAIRTVANSLPENEIILLTLLISMWYVPYTDLRKNDDRGSHIPRVQRVFLFGTENRSPRRCVPNALLMI